MGLEIERKFLLKDDSWRAHILRSEPMRQGYLISDDFNSVRVRITGQQAHLNIKSATIGLTRTEFEYTIPLADAETILNTLCRGPLVEKTRHWVIHGTHEWEIDEFAGANSGLIVAELELDTSNEVFERPSWASTEVTDDKRYYNAYLARCPYQEW